MMDGGEAERSSAVDEMVDGRGGIRKHWLAVLGAIHGMDWTVLTERVRRLGSAAADDDGEDGEVGWRCDPVPLPLTNAEFSQLEEGLTQRARLLEAVRADLYGPQLMLAEGRLPAALVDPNPAYLRACRTVGEGGAPAVGGGGMLQAYAADLMRGPDGAWRVVADRTGGVLGISYARECRRKLARVVPELFRSSQVRQLRPFFEAWQDALMRFGARADGRVPVVAMLTPGPGDPHWPEHLLLSRDLGAALVEARDLTVRGGALSIKTLGGLLGVDVLLRRVPGETLDPLELSPGGDGVTGLLDAWRQGALQVLNHPGAAVVEAPAMAAFLPELCQRLLGEALLTPSVPTVWLADEGAARRMVEEPDRWSVRPALDAGAVPAPLTGLSRDARSVLETSMAAAPWAHAGSASMTPSLAPCFGPKRLEPRPVVLRLFLMHDGSQWRMMPGGLARVLAPGDQVTEAMPPHAVLKDVWVVSEEGGLIQGPVPVPQAPMAVRRSASTLPSRVADDFYWLGRYVERLEGQARLGRAGLLRRARGSPLPREIAELQVLGRCLRASGMEADERGRSLDEQLRLSLVAPGSIGTGLQQASRLIEALRDRMTIETHGAFTHAMRAARAEVAEAWEAQAGIDGLVHAMTGLQRLATTVSGGAAEGMVRGGGRLFLDLGRRVERAMTGAHVLAAVLQEPPARMEGTLRLALELCDSAITYRARYLSVLQPVPVLDLVLADEGNPRSLGYQWAQAAVLLEEAGDPDLAGLARAWGQRVAGLVEEVARGGADGGGAGLAMQQAAQTLVGVGDAAAEMSERITRRFFALLPRLQAVGLEVA